MAMASMPQIFICAYAASQAAVAAAMIAAVTSQCSALKTPNRY
jgi:hypothetical protein